MTTRLGFTAPVMGFSLRESCELAVRAEQLGYTDCWSAETSGCDGFSVASAVGVSTETMRIGLAVAPVFSRPPALTAMSALAAHQASGGRFCLGLGASSPVIVGGWMGQPYEQPLTRMRETVEIVKAAFAGDKVKIQGRTVSSTGFRLEDAPGGSIPVFLAALGPKMLALASEVADGVALYLASEEGVRLAGKEAPDKELVERIMCCPDEPSDQVRGAARWFMTPYLAVPAYNAFVARQGFESEAVALASAWSVGDRTAARDAVTDELIDALVIHGPAEACKERLDSFRDAGLSTPILGLFSVTSGKEGVAAALERLAPN